MQQQGFVQISSQNDYKSVAKQIFEQFDQGKKGKIDIKDCVPMIKTTSQPINPNFNPSQLHLDAFFKVLDRNNDGTVTYQDIEELCERYLCGKISLPPPKPQVQPEKNEETVKRAQKQKYTAEIEQRLDVARRLFKRFDRDGSGKLQEEEIAGLLKATYEQMGINDFEPTQEDVRMWIYMADTDMDGCVSLEEYEQVIIKSLRNSGIKIDQQVLVFDN